MCCVPSQIYKIGKKGDASHNATTEFDMTEKDITPMGGFAHYGEVKEDYLMIKVGAGRACAQTALLPLAVGSTNAPECSFLAVPEHNTVFHQPAAYVRAVC